MDNETQLENFWNALAESVWEMSDEEVEEEIAENDSTEAVRQILLNAVYERTRH